MRDKTRRRQIAAESKEEQSGGAGVAIIGVGAVGSSLARSLHRSKYRVLALISRSRKLADSLALEIGGTIVSGSVVDIPDETGLIFICTREEIIPTVVAELLQTELNFAGSVVGHVSGRESASILAPLAERGARTLSFHPLGSFPPEITSKTFAGLTIGLEGDPLAMEVGKVVARDLGARAVEIPTGAKSTYHLAAALTSNFLVTLMGDVEDILASADLPRDLTMSLAADTLQNLRESTPEQALTGPIVRADKAALADQIRTLRDVAPQLLPRFVALVMGTIDLAHRSGRVSSEDAAALCTIVRDSTEA